MQWSGASSSLFFRVSCNSTRSVNRVNLFVRPFTSLLSFLPSSLPSSFLSWFQSKWFHLHELCLHAWTLTLQSECLATLLPLSVCLWGRLSSAVRPFFPSFISFFCMQVFLSIRLLSSSLLFLWSDAVVVHGSFNDYSSCLFFGLCSEKLLKKLHGWKSVPLSPSRSLCICVSFRSPMLRVPLSFLF